MQKQENNSKQILQRTKFLRDRQPQFVPVKLDQKLAFAGLAESLVYICSQLRIYRNLIVIVESNQQHGCIKSSAI